MGVIVDLAAVAGWCAGAAFDAGRSRGSEGQNGGGENVGELHID